MFLSPLFMTLLALTTEGAEKTQRAAEVLLPTQMFFWIEH
jgi:hypothetical protein